MTDIPPPPPSGWQAPQPGGYGYTQGAAPAQYAGVGARFGAMLLDGLIVSLFIIPAFVALFAGPKEVTPCSVDASGQIVFGGPDNALCEGPTGTTWAIFAVLAIAGAIAGIAYYAKGDGKGQTVGKRATNIKVVDADTGAPIGTGRGVGRYFARLLSGAPFYLGYFWALWDKRKQTWHDKLARSVVVKA